MLRPTLTAAALLVATAGALATPATPPTKPGVSRPNGQATQDQNLPFELMVGDKAPPLAVETWVKGEPITGFEKGKVYVVEFWATWCGPCIAAMPHLTELQKKYKDDGVTVIGLTSTDPNNSPAAVEKMIAGKGDAVGYTVAWDRDRDTYGAYMDAAFQRGIPCSFLVDKDGRIAFIGHPMQLDKPLADVVAGTYDLDAAVKAHHAKMAPQADSARLFFTIRAGDVPKARAMYEEIKRANPRQAQMNLGPIFQLCLRNGGADDIRFFAEEILVPNADNAYAHNFVAWSIIDPDAEVKHRDLDLALRTAERAADLSGHNEPAILDTLALAHFLKGNTDKAVEIQTKAVSLAEGAMKDELQGRLDQFKAKK